MKLAALLCLLAASCTQQQVKDAASVAGPIADAVCTILEASSDSDNVDLACQAVDAATGAVKVFTAKMPKPKAAAKLCGVAK